MVKYQFYKIAFIFSIITVQFSSVAQLCPTLYDPMNCSMPGLPVHTDSRSSLRLTSIESVMPSSHFIPCPPLLLLPPIPSSIRVFSNESTFTWGGQSTGVSVSASFLPKNTQGWFPLEWTVCISLQSKEPSRESSPTPQFKSINSSVLSFLHSPILAFIQDYWKNHSLD